MRVSKKMRTKTWGALPAIALGRLADHGAARGGRLRYPSAPGRPATSPCSRCHRLTPVDPLCMLSTHRPRTHLAPRPSPWV